MLKDCVKYYLLVYIESILARYSEYQCKSIRSNFYKYYVQTFYCH